MSIKRDQQITSLYDTILDKTIGNVLMAFFTGTAGQAWDALLTLYDVLDDDIQKEVKELIDEIQTHINKQMGKRGYAQSDLLKKRKLLASYVNDKKHELFNKIIRLLIKHGYLQRIFHPVKKEDFKEMEESEG